MQHQTDAGAPPYYHQYYQNPATTTAAAAAADPPPFNPDAASAPPISYSHYDYNTISQPAYFPQISDHNTNPNPNYSFPQNQAPANYDYAIPANANPNSVPTYNPQFASDAYSYGAPAAPLPYSLEGFGGGGGGQEVFDGGVYKYNGGEKGGRSSDFGSGAGNGSGTGVMFDDYGRPISVSGGKEQTGFGNSPSKKIVKAAPNLEDSQDVRNGIQKYRVKMLSEGYGQTAMDVLCQIGLDGIRILDPATSRTLKIYPLEGVVKWEVLDSYIFAFWARTSVDPEPRRIRLKSNSYTTNNILDTVTAASIQSQEIGASSSSSDVAKANEQSGEKKKGFIDWKNLIKPINEEKDHWVPDEAATKCKDCRADFSAFNRKHHCRNCGDIFCDKCTQGRIALTADDDAQPVRVCDRCMAEVTQRLANNDASSRVTGLQTHDDLARKLQEEMDKKRKTGSKSEPSGTGMREVACPICTVHLQVVVPTSGSETIECGVCQHPFLVNAY